MSEGATLRAATYLGDNAVAIMGSLSEVVGARARVELAFDTTAGRSSASARRYAADADLLWACGLLTANLVEAGTIDAEIVAAPVFTGEDAAEYHSVIIAWADRGPDLLERPWLRIAVNEGASFSGHHVLAAHLDESELAHDDVGIVETGSHRQSALAVANGGADVAAIDHTVWEYLYATVHELQHLEVVARTASYPAPPFAVRRGLPDDARDRLVDTLLAVSAGDVPGIDRVESASLDDYSSLVALADRHKLAM